MLLREINIQKPKIIKEQQNQDGQLKPLKFKLNLIRCDTQGYNRRIFPKQEMEKQIEQILPKVKNRQLIGELDHPTGDDERVGYIYIKEQSHVITDISFNGDLIEGTIEILNTPNGKILESVIEQDVQIGQSLRQVGELIPTTNNLYKAQNIDIITWDIVQNPSYDVTYFTKEALVENVQYMIKNRYKKLFEGQNLKSVKDKLIELVQFKFIDEYGLTIDNKKILESVISVIKEEVENLINIKG